MARKRPTRKEHTLNAAAAPDLAVLAKNVALLRAARYTRTELAEAVGVSYATISHIENAENWPTMPVYLALCRVLCHDVVIPLL